MNLTKEQQIVRSLLLSDFHWVKIDSNGGSYSKKLKHNSFKGNVCPKATFHDFSFRDDKPLKTWKEASECQEWMPKNILHASFESYLSDRTGKTQGYKTLTKNIDSDTKLLLEVYSGSISGVGYGKGWYVTVSFVYKNIIFKLYSYKTSENQYELEAFYDIDYIRSLDFSNMKENKTGDLYSSEYYPLRTYTSTKPQDMSDVLSLAMTDDTIVFSKQFSMNFRLIKGISSSDDCIFSKETLKLVSPKKILLQDNFNIEDTFDIPESLKEITLDFKKHKYGKEEDGITEEFIDRNRNLGKYLKCNDDCEKIAAREIYNKELSLCTEEVRIWFTYKELSGFVSTNKYQLGLFEDYYKDATEVVFKVGDAEFTMPIKNFWNCLKIEKDKKIKHAKDFSKGMSVFGRKIGYHAWFPKEADGYPQYTGKTKISTQKFEEAIVEKETKRKKKEAFKRKACIEAGDILPALKENETIEKVVLKSLEDVAHDIFYEAGGLDDDGATETMVFKIGESFYEIDLHCEAEWVGDWSVRKNLPGDLSVLDVREIKEFTIEEQTKDYIELKY